MPRAIWSGAISFGLVNVPVKLYAAVSTHDLRFHFFHTKDDSRIGYEKVCKKEGKPVPEDQIQKAYETDKGELVYLEDEDFEAAQPQARRTIELSDFVPYEQIDPIYFEHTYYVGADEGAEKVYALLAKAMEESGLVAIGSFVFHDREQLGCLRVADGVLLLEKMHFADEIRPADDVAPSGVRVGKRELEMASELIDRLAGDFDPKRYKDTYRDALLKVIGQKRKGKQVKLPKREREEAPEDLMEALLASLERSKQGKASSAKGSSKRSSTGRAPRKRAARAGK
jgi:DNA end-binding protein Ku